jgi:hypothetical protein
MVPWVKQGESTTWPFFVQDSSGDAVTGLTDGSFTKRISKAGGAWADLSATIAETENGWYTVAFSSSDTNTRGAMAVRLTASGAQQTNLLFQVVTRLPWEFAYPTTAGRSIDVATDGVVGIDLNNSSGALVNGSDITGVPTVAEIVDGVHDEALSGHTTAGTVGEALGRLDDIQTDTEDLQTQIGTDGAGLTSLPWPSAWDAEVQSEVNDGLVAFFTSAAQLVDDIWDEAKAGHAGAGSFGEEVQAHSLSTEVAGLNDISTADVNAEVLDVIDTDTRGEPAQGAPGVTISLGDKIDYLYKAWRNQCTTTASVYSVFNDDAATVDHKATISDDGTTFTVGEVGAGP